MYNIIKVFVNKIKNDIKNKTPILGRTETHIKNNSFVGAIIVGMGSLLDLL